jgi:hypothetical protein
MAVPEGVDAREVQDQRGDSKQRGDETLVDHVTVPEEKFFHGIRHKRRSQWPEPDLPAAVRLELDDIVGSRLPDPCVAARAALRKLVQTKTCGRGKPDLLVFRMNPVQCTAIADDLLLGAVPRRRISEHERPQAISRNRHPLDPIRGLGALHDGKLAQRLEDLWRLVFVELLAAPGLGHRLDHPDRAL